MSGKVVAIISHGIQSFRTFFYHFGDSLYRSFLKLLYNFYSNFERTKTISWLNHLIIIPFNMIHLMTAILFRIPAFVQDFSSTKLHPADIRCLIFT